MDDNHGTYNLYYDKHCQISSGVYVKSLNNKKKTNTGAPRTIDAIYLTKTLNIQECHVVMYF